MIASVFCLLCIYVNVPVPLTTFCCSVSDLHATWQPW